MVILKLMVVKYTSIRKKILDRMGIGKSATQIESPQFTKSEVQYILSIIASAKITISGSDIQKLYDIVYKLQELHKSL